MRLAANLIVLSLAWWAAGCSLFAPPRPPGAGPGLVPGLGKSGDPAQEVLLVQVRMLGIEVPLGSASGSEDIWSYVDEESVRASGSALGRNGFRVGLARRENWSSLERIFKQLAGRQAKDAALTLLPNNPLQIVLNPDQPVQTLFLFRADKTLTGEDYPPSDNLLTLVCALNEDEPNQVIIVGQPQLRSKNETVRIAEERGIFMWVVRPKVYELPDLTFRLSVPSNDIIVMGPGVAARRPSSVAHHFLIKERDGMPFETVLVLVPSVVRAQARTVPAGPAGNPPGQGPP
jgi:hypothetical protein